MGFIVGHVGCEFLSASGVVDYIDVLVGSTVGDEGTLTVVWVKFGPSAVRLVDVNSGTEDTEMG